MPQFSRTPRGILVAAMLTLAMPVINHAQEGPVVPRPETVRSNVFTPPAGLTRPADVLLRELGFLDCCSNASCVPYSYNFCMEVAIKCHVQGRYADSLAFVVRATEIRTTPAALWLRALNELALNQCDDAATTVTQFKSLPGTGVDFGWLREKLSSPLTVRLKALFEAI